MIDPSFPIDWRLGVAILTLLLAGVAKAATGMGVPVAGVPILVALYGDLRMVLVTTIVATAGSDLPMLWKYRHRYRDALRFAPFLAASILGVFVGTRILTSVNVAILSGGLAIVVFAFITVSWLGRVPTMSPELAAKLGPAMGLLCGVLQGSTGASGPVLTSYLISVRLTREAFLFAIIAMFSVSDWAQLISLQSLHLTTLPVFLAALGIFALVLIGMVFGFAIHKRINDALFRRGVLIMLGIAACGLLVRASRG